MEKNTLGTERHDPRVLQRARLLCEQDRAPPEQFERYIDRARELMAIEAHPDVARIPVRKTIAEPGARPFGEPVEPIDEAIRNQGEFPTLTDQGEERLFPDSDKSE